MKRFTETNKWRDPWYRKLSSGAKQLWEYLRDNCDAIGVIDVDLSLISADCGQEITEGHIAELGDRIQRISEKKLFLPKFINFQYGELNHSCPPHRSIIRLVESHKLVRVGLHYAYPNATLTPENSQVPVVPTNPSYPSVTLALPLRQDKTRLDKTSTEGVLGENGKGDGWGTIGIIRERLNRMFGRKATDPWDYSEEHALATVCRRPDAVFELGEIQKFRDSINPSEIKFSGFPKTLGKLLDGWSGALDLARAVPPPATERRLPGRDARGVIQDGKL